MKKKSETKEFKNYVCIFEFENYTQSLSYLMFKSLKLITNNFIPWILQIIFVAPKCKSSFAQKYLKIRIEFFLSYKEPFIKENDFYLPGNKVLIKDEPKTKESYLL